MTNAPGYAAIEQKYLFAKSSSITLCPPFFDDTKFPNVIDLAKDYKTHNTLDKIDCAERIILHEMSHLRWTLNTPGGGFDYTGWLKAAQVAGGGNGKKADWRSAGQLADGYAWYALYSYWNKFAGGGPACAYDAWPEDTPKPNPTAF